jgi:hypothetical protein
MAGIVEVEQVPSATLLPSNELTALPVIIWTRHLPGLFRERQTHCINLGKMGRYGRNR